MPEEKEPSYVEIPPQVAGRSGKQLAYKNKNPGNVEFVGQPGARKSSDGRFAEFDTPEAGLADVHRIIKLHQNDSLHKYISAYAPPGENDTAAYVANASKALGVSPNTPVSKINPNKLAAFIIQQESGSKIKKGRMPQDQEAPQVETISRDKALGWFRSQLESGRPAQVQFFEGLHQKLGHDPTDDDVVSAMGEVPQFKSKYVIEGTKPGAQTPPPPPTAGDDNKVSASGIAKSFLDIGTTPLVGRTASQFLESKQSQLKDPLSRFTGQLATEGARFAEDMTSPLSLVTLGLGPIIRGATSASRAVKLAKGAEKTVRLGYGGAQGVSAAQATMEFFKNPTAENAAKIVSSGTIAAGSAIPEIGARGRGTKAVSAGEAPPELTPSGEGNVRTAPGYDDDRVPRSRRLTAPIAEKDIVELQNASGLPREKIEPLTKLAPWEMQSRIDFLRRNMESETSPIPDITGGKTTNQTVQLREGMKREVKALELLLQDKGITPARSPQQSRPGQRGMPAEDRDFNVWRDTHFKRDSQGMWEPKQAPKSSREEFIGSYTGERLREEFNKRQGQRSLTSGGGSQTVDTSGIRMAQAPPPEGVHTEGMPKIDVIGAPKEHARIEGGPSGHRADPRAQTRINAVEANRLAEKHGVSPSGLVELSGMPSDQLVKQVNQMQQIRRALQGAPGDMMLHFPHTSDLPAEAIGRRVPSMGRARAQFEEPSMDTEGPNTYAVHKEEVIGQLNRWIDALTDMMLYSRRGQGQAPPPPE